MCGVYIFIERWAEAQPTKELQRAGSYKALMVFNRWRCYDRSAFMPSCVVFIYSIERWAEAQPTKELQRAGSYKALMVFNRWRCYGRSAFMPSCVVFIYS
ncbi:hypothetical protein B5D82_02245 [Cognaticolwellia beringensis]|uniref:Uncharacterized protein n=1 Tax=Cognaticolwellia beringensis TaxID=1967665 RepID=A0A222G453_9GAMM|nr:hypothetical protein B5D82_02245 [Cognaticolwellia beringensis]